MSAIRPYEMSDRDWLADAMAAHQRQLVALDPAHKLCDGFGYGDIASSDLLDRVYGGRGELFIAERDGERVGFIAGYLPGAPHRTAELFHGYPDAVITDLYLAVPDRELQAQLLDAMMQRLEQAGAHLTAVMVLDADRDMDGALRARGFAPRMTQLVKAI